MAYRRYSSNYVQQEDGASRAKVGIWRGEFVPPWDWRLGTRLNAATERPGACLVTRPHSVLLMHSKFSDQAH